MKKTKLRHTISLLVENRFGVLTRIAGLFSGRGFNIDSLTVAQTVDPTISRMTIVTRDNGQIIEQILKQLRKLIDVIKVVDLCEEDYVEREMALIKVKAEPENRAEILRITDIFRGKIVDVSPTIYTLEITGDEEKLGAIINLLKPINIIEIARTGKVALGRGNKVLKL
jgi:acetolactate synthase I/III small subunit